MYFISEVTIRSLLLYLGLMLPPPIDACAPPLDVKHIDGNVAVDNDKWGGYVEGLEINLVAGKVYDGPQGGQHGAASQTRDVCLKDARGHDGKGTCDESGEKHREVGLDGGALSKLKHLCLGAPNWLKAVVLEAFSVSGCPLVSGAEALACGVQNHVAGRLGSVGKPDLMHRHVIRDHVNLVAVVVEIRVGFLGTATIVLGNKMDGAGSFASGGLSLGWCRVSIALGPGSARGGTLGISFPVSRLAACGAV